MMFRNLSPGAVGISVGSLAEGIELVKASGFQGIDVNIGEVARLIEESSADAVRGMFDEAGVRPGGWGLPVNWRGDEETFQKDLERLPGLAQAGQAIGATRVPTWVLSFSDDRPFDENFAWHVERFRPVAQILKDHGCSLGLEFLGPKTIRDGHTYEFIHSSAGMLELGAEIGTGNVGLLLDCWHWYTAHETLEDITKLTPADVVYVHVNDAPEGIEIDEQIDSVRRMPAETGVIDLVGFLKALDEIGYDGPIAPEPFSDKPKGLPPIEAATLTNDYLMKAWTPAGLS